MKLTALVRMLDASMSPNHNETLMFGLAEYNGDGSLGSNHGETVIEPESVAQDGPVGASGMNHSEIVVESELVALDLIGADSANHSEIVAVS